MERLFLIVFNMSTTGAAVILFVLLARLLLRKAPKAFSYALWAVVLFRLLCPFTVKSPVSLAPDLSAEPLFTNRTIRFYAGDDSVYVFPTPAPDVPGQTPLVLPEGVAGVPAAFVPKKAPGPRLSVTASGIWLAGVVLLLAYSAVSLFLLRRRLIGSVPLEGENNVRLADHIPSPFVLGLVQTKIYLPSSLSEEEREYILLHERTHIRRFDHVTRALAWLALTIHWFNPLVWLAFHLAGKDMEMSCDEAVLRKMGRDVRADYSATLLRLSVDGKLPAGPLAFGGGDPESRIKNVLSYRKPALWVVAAALAGVLCAGVALATEPNDFIDPDSITSFTCFNAISSTITDRNTIVYTPDNLRRDMEDTANIHSVPQKDGAELVRLLNLYRRSVYGRGEQTLNGSEHNFVRMDLKDGGFYLLDFWYWNGFSFHPLHFCEDSYTTLVTYYDAQGNAGTTWQMEYAFDRAYKDWRSGLRNYTQAEAQPPNPGLDSSVVDVSFSLEQLEDGDPFVRVSGTVYGTALSRAVWNPETEFSLLGEHSGGELTMEYMFAGGGASLGAWWTDGTRTSVTVSTKLSMLYSSYIPSGWWEFTVNLPDGTVTKMVSHGMETTLSTPVRMYPESITNAEAVRLAQIVAKVLPAAEDFYDNARSAPSPAPSGLNPS